MAIRGCGAASACHRRFAEIDLRTTSDRLWSSRRCWSISTLSSASSPSSRDAVLTDAGGFDPSRWAEVSHFRAQVTEAVANLNLATSALDELDTPVTTFSRSAL